MPTTSTVVATAAAAAATVAAALAVLRRTGVLARFSSTSRRVEAALKGDAELSRVAFSSRWVAYERAIESARPDALFQDPLAEALGGASGRRASEDMAAVFEKNFGWGDWHVQWMAVRTRFIDDLLVAFAAATQPSFQVVNVGAGLDTRPMRIDALRACRAVFEVDVPEVLAAKQRVLATHGARAVCPCAHVAVDLREADALERALLVAGLDPTVPIFWLVEGVTMYLEEEVNAALLGAMRKLSAPKSQLCVGFTSPTAPEAPAVLRYAPGPEIFRATLEALGYRHVRVAVYGDEALNFGRYPEGRAPDLTQCLATALVA